MAYGTFKSIQEVAQQFDIEVTQRIAFASEKELEIPELLFTMITDDINDDTNYVSEYSICDGIIRPILNIVAKHYPLKVWSHVPYNVDKDKGLMGEPDYLIAQRNKYGGMDRPALCVIEAKKDNFDDGWTQALAEMVASSLLGANYSYAAVTTGNVWQFGKLKNSVFTIDAKPISAPVNLQRVFNTLNWIFAEICTNPVTKA